MLHILTYSDWNFELQKISVNLRVFFFHFDFLSLLESIFSPETEAGLTNMFWAGDGYLLVTCLMFFGKAKLGSRHFYVF